MIVFLILLGAVLLAGVVFLVAVTAPEHFSSRSRASSHSHLDNESQAYRDHTPGGGTGSL